MPQSITRTSSLAIDADSETIYAVLGEYVYFVGHDDGERWTRPNVTGLTGREFRDLAADPLVPSRLYAAGDHGLYRSEDGGESWQVVWAGEQMYLDGYPVTRGFVGAPKVAADSTVYIIRRFKCSNHECVGGNIFKSTDAGDTWQTMGLVNRMARQLVLTRDRLDLLYAFAFGPEEVLGGRYPDTGLYRSQDGGATWEMTLRNNWFVALAVDPSDGDTVYGAVTWRFWTPMGKSTDGGKMWTPIFPTGIRDDNFHVNALLVDPLKPHIVYAATTFGALRSVDGGRTWREFTSGIPDRCSVWTLAAAPKTRMLYATLECNPHPEPPYHAVFAIDRFAGTRRRAAGR